MCIKTRAHKTSMQKSAYKYVCSMIQIICTTKDVHRHIESHGNTWSHMQMHTHYIVTCYYSTEHTQTLVNIQYNGCTKAYIYFND